MTDVQKIESPGNTPEDSIAKALTQQIVFAVVVFAVSVRLFPALCSRQLPPNLLHLACPAGLAAHHSAFACEKVQFINR